MKIFHRFYSKLVPSFHSIQYFLMFFSLFSRNSPAETLSLPAYLNQVEQNHTGLRSALQIAQAGSLRNQASALFMHPAFFVSSKMTSDAKMQPLSFLNYDRLISWNSSLGVQQNTWFGLNAKLHYDLYTQEYLNPDLTLFQLPNSFSRNFTRYANVSTTLEITQNLWSNQFGKSTQATFHLNQATGLASYYTARYRIQQILSQAEIAYWRLLTARKSLKIGQDAIERAQKLYQWHAKRARLHLGEPVDVLQAKALLKTRELEWLTAQNEEKQASLDFNALRNVTSEGVQEQIITEPMLYSPPTPTFMNSNDVLAAEQNNKMTLARSQITYEDNQPKLDLSISATLNGQKGVSYYSLADSFRASFSIDRPTFIIGVNFSAPLDFDLKSKLQSSAHLEEIAADLEYTQKQRQQQQNWQSLAQSYQENQKELDLFKKLEQIQSQKLKIEETRLKQGRTTTYQVLIFEQDYLQAQQRLIQSQWNLLKILAQMKLFGDES